LNTMSPCALILKTCFLLIATSGVHSALAEGDHEGSWWGGKRGSEGRGGQMAVASPQYQKECASCHMAYPAGLLPAGSWQHLMANLNQHYGSDASLDAASTSAITQYLTSNAGTYKRVSEMPAQDRITQSAWFARKHDGHVNASIWKRQSIGSRSNCVACHGAAEQGNFNEHSVRIPG
jgi:hypothetical protein